MSKSVALFTLGFMLAAIGLIVRKFAARKGGLVKKMRTRGNAFFY